MATILVTDDDPVTRIFMEELLRQEGHHVLLAADGQEALVLLEEQDCDLIFMDIQMPVLDGYLATRRIKAMRPQWFVPVIFLTSVQTDRELAHCLECGGDDFINKPPSPIILKARIQVWLQRAKLANRLAMDRQDVENVILKMRQDTQFDPRGLRVMMTSLEKTNGDIVLSTCRSDGVQYLMVGDFTGHGLAAAVCGPLVADIFYRLTRQDFPLQAIIDQLNDVIYHRLPANMFMAATFLELDRPGGGMRVWNAALPSGVLIRAGMAVQRFPSTRSPLGITPHLGGNDTSEWYPLSWGDRIFLFSDGSVETRSATGEFFGDERLVRFLETLVTSGAELDSLLVELDAFRAGRDPIDDITLIEVQWVQQ
ncbi:MAG: SpoIIE family protein phosphatase [Magnetococcus sp. YQC-5]